MVDKSIKQDMAVNTVASLAETVVNYVTLSITMSGIGKHCCKNKREWHKTYHTELVFTACYCNPRRATLQINKLVASLATNGHRVPLPTRPNARELATAKLMRKNYRYSSVVLTLPDQ
ncbi:hypothetical protein CBL_12282 [Carabus blaptoides fortunei]